MKIFYTVFYFLFFFLLNSCFISFSQNLVPNPSFEDTVDCPDNASTIAYSSSWSSCGNTPDYFNKCATNSNYSIPNNGWGNQNVSICSAYAGFWAYYSFSPNSRELISSKMATVMTIGQKYFVSLKISLAELSNCGVNKLGVRFSTKDYSQDTIAVPINNFSNVFTNNIIYDTINWVMISGSFIADSAYEYIMIGNFFSDDNTDTVRLKPPQFFGYGAYYYLDDICVSLDSAFCNPFVYFCSNVILENQQDNFIKIFPNPTDEKINIDIFESKATLEVYNSLGSLVISQELFEGNNFLNYTLSSGIYFFYVIAGDKILTKKIILT